jgi:hypothetical protein
MNSESITRWIISVCAVLIVVLLGYQTIADFLSQKKCNEFISNTTSIRTSLSGTYSDLVTDYNSAAYDNPSVERIAEQQLLGTEFTLMGVVAQSAQTDYLIQLISACH